MASKTEKKLADKLLLFSRIILFLFTIGFVCWLQKQESNYLKQDVFDLTQLSAIDNKLINISTVYANTTNWLEEHHAQLASDRNDIIIEVERWLRTQAEAENIRLGFKDFSDKRFKEFQEDKLIDFDTHFNYFYEGLSFADESIQAMEEDYETRDTESNENIFRIDDSLVTVGDYLDKLNAIAKPRSLYVPNRLANAPPDFKIIQERVFLIEGVFFHRNQLKLFVRHKSNFFSQKMSILKKNYYITLETKKLDAPSVLSFSIKNSENNITVRKLQELHDDLKRKELLRMTYGHLLIDDALGIASEGLTQVYKSVNIFGFSFPTRWVPFIMLFCLGYSVWGNFAIVVIAKERNFKVISVDVDDPVDMLIDNAKSRFVIWAVLPPLTVWMAMPNIPLSIHAYVIIFTGMAGMMLMGLTAYFISKQT
jgi:hypothetical protein